MKLITTPNCLLAELPKEAEKVRIEHLPSGSTVDYSTGIVPQCIYLPSGHYTKVVRAKDVSEEEQNLVLSHGLNLETTWIIY